MNLRLVLVLAVFASVTACECGNPDVQTSRPDATRSTVEVTPADGVLADGVASSELRVQVRDAEGRPLEAQQVEVLVEGEGATIEAPAATNVEGLSVARLRATRAGTKVLTVTVGEGADAVVLAERPTVGFVDPALANARLAFVAVPERVTAGEAFALQVEVLDELNQRVDVANLAVSLSLIEVPDALHGPGRVDVVGGVAAFEGISISRAGKARVLRASAAGMAAVDSAPIEVTVGALSVAASSVSVMPEMVVADGVATATITVRATDVHGNGVTAVPVELSVVGAAASLSASSGTTDAEGVFTATLTSTVAEHKTVKATVGGQALSPATVTFVAGEVAVLELASAPSAIPADGVASAQVTARALDARGNRVPGAAVALEITGANNTVTPSALVTGDDGEAVAVARGTTSGDQELIARHGALVATAPLELTPAPVSVSGVSSSGGAGCFQIDYSLQQTEARHADVRVEYHKNGTWHRASQAGAETGSGVRSLSTSATGTAHSFHWNTSRDLPLYSGSLPVRIVASSQGAADGLSSPINVQVGNGLKFAAPVAVTLGTQVPSATAHADVDLDGDLDLLVPSSSPAGVAVVLGSAQGFSLSQNLSTPSLQPAYVVAADLDRDGDLDLAVAGPASDSVDLRFSTSPGGFPSASSGSLTLGANARGLASGDFNRNGTPELLGLTSTGWLEVFSRTTGTSFAVMATVNTGANANALALGDLDDDGHPDAIVASVSGVSLWKSQANGTFVSFGSHPVSGGVSNVATADFNRDGWLDVAALHAGGANVSVIFGSASGGLLSAAGTLSAPGAGITSADVDSDGDADLLVAHASGIQLLTNDGAGLFGPATALSSSAFSGIVAVDVDRDGRVELIAARPSMFQLEVFANQTPAYCQPAFAGTRLVETLDQPASVLLHDFDRDGRADLAVSESGAGMVSLRRGRGDGTFGAPDTKGVGVQPRGLIKADLNGDGFVDLLTANQGDATVSVLLGSATGFGSAGSFPAGPGAHQLVAGRFDADAHLDVMTVNATGNTMTLLPGDGQGALGAPVLRHTFSAGAVKGIAAGDYDRDGDLDVAVTSGPTVVLLKNDGSGAFAQDRSMSVSTGPEALAFADMDRNGMLDVVVGSAGKVVAVALQAASGSFTSKNYYGPDIVTAISVVDLDHDGDLDVVGAGSVTVGTQRGRNVVRFLNDGAGALGTGKASAAGFGLVALDVADVDGDGSLDVAVANTPLNRVSIALGDGQAGFLDPVRSPSANPPTHTLLDFKLADLNHDGRADAVSLVPGPGSIGVQLAQPGGGFGPLSLYSAGGTTQDFALADFNRDGHLDVAVGTNATFALLLGDGSGGFGPHSNPLAIGAVSAVAAADIDRDGHQDLVLVTQGASSRVYFGAGDGTFPAIFSVGGDSGAWNLLLADVDRDGWTDVVVPSKTLNYVAVYKNPRARGGTFIKQTLNTGANSGPTRVAFADVDRDGWADLVSAHGGTARGASWVKVGPGLSLAFGGAWSTLRASDDLAVADLDADGAVEIVLPSGFEQVVSVIDTADGAISDWAAGVEARAAEAQDDDRDGRGDLLICGFSAVNRLTGR